MDSEKEKCPIENNMCIIYSYNQLNADFQRITRRDKKAFFNEQCKEIKENNQMGKTGDLFKKIGDIKGTFHVKMVKMQ